MYETKFAVCLSLKLGNTFSSTHLREAQEQPGRLYVLTSNYSQVHFKIVTHPVSRGGRVNKSLVGNDTVVQAEHSLVKFLDWIHPSKFQTRWFEKDFFFVLPTLSRNKKVAKFKDTN